MCQQKAPTKGRSGFLCRVYGEEDGAALNQLDSLKLIELLESDIKMLHDRLTRREGTAAFADLKIFQLKLMLSNLPTASIASELKQHITKTRNDIASSERVLKQLLKVPSKKPAHKAERPKNRGALTDKRKTPNTTKQNSKVQSTQNEQLTQQEKEAIGELPTFRKNHQLVTAAMELLSQKNGALLSSSEFDELLAEVCGEHAETSGTLRRSLFKHKLITVHETKSFYQGKLYNAAESASGEAATNPRWGKFNYSIVTPDGDRIRIHIKSYEEFKKLDQRLQVTVVAGMYHNSKVSNIDIESAASTVNAIVANRSGIPQKTVTEVLGFEHEAGTTFKLGDPSLNILLDTYGLFPKASPAVDPQLQSTESPNNDDEQAPGRDEHIAQDYMQFDPRIPTDKLALSPITPWRHTAIPQAQGIFKYPVEGFIEGVNKNHNVYVVVSRLNEAQFVTVQGYINQDFNIPLSAELKTCKLKYRPQLSIDGKFIRNMYTISCPNGITDEVFTLISEIDKKNEEAAALRAEADNATSERRTAAQRKADLAQNLAAQAINR